MSWEGVKIWDFHWKWFEKILELIWFALMTFSKASKFPRFSPTCFERRKAREVRKPVKIVHIQVVLIVIDNIYGWPLHLFLCAKKFYWVPYSRENKVGLIQNPRGFLDALIYEIFWKMLIFAPCLLSKQYLFKGVTGLVHAYFWAMLIFKKVLIARIVRPQWKCATYLASWAPYSRASAIYCLLLIMQ